MIDVIPKIQALFLLPPGIILVVALLGFLIHIRWPLLGTFVIFLSTAALLVLSLPLTGYQLSHEIESSFPPLRIQANAESKSSHAAIVILGGGRYEGASEFGGGDDVSRTTLERLRYGAHLHRLTGLPILVSGGTVYGETVSEGDLMKAVLVRDFRTDAKWVEGKSLNTFENARYSKKILAEAGIERIYLVTHAVHMRRAVWSFEHEGIVTVAAPMGFVTLGKKVREALGYFPSASGLLLSSQALRERLGLIWYRHHYGEATPATPAAAPAPAR